MEPLLILLKKGILDFSSLAVAMGVCFLCLYLLAPLAKKVGLIDKPNNRKMHTGHVPLIGGIAMFLGLFFALLTLNISLQPYRAFIFGCALMVIIGLLDDFHELSAKLRLVGQLMAAAGMVFWGGTVLSSLGQLFFNGDVLLCGLAIPFTLFATVGLINSVNIIDGLDGLAGAISFVQLAYLFILARATGMHDTVLVLSLVMGVLSIFLIFNFPWKKNILARVFMGDAGSLWLGFIFAWFTINISQHSLIVHPVYMLWIMGVPLFDTGFVLLYRLLKGNSPFEADRNHLHHFLLQYFSARTTTLYMMGFSIILGGVGLFSYMKQLDQSWCFSAFILLFSLYFLMATYSRRRRRVLKNR